MKRFLSFCIFHSWFLFREPLRRQWDARSHGPPQSAGEESLRDHSMRLRATIWQTVFWAFVVPLLAMGNNPLQLFQISWKLLFFLPATISGFTVFVLLCQESQAELEDTSPDLPLSFLDEEA